MAKFQEENVSSSYTPFDKGKERPLYDYKPEPVLATNVKPTYAEMRGAGAAIKGKKYNRDA